MADQKGHRTQTYTRRHWRCESCGRKGFVLVHRDDTPAKAAWRREQSHGAQSARSRLNPCRGRHLLWFTNAQELAAADVS